MGLPDHARSGAVSAYAQLSRGGGTGRPARDETRRDFAESTTDRLIGLGLSTEPKGMIPAVHRVQRGQLSKALEGRLKQIPSSEWIPGSLDEEHRNPDIREMRIAHPFRLTGRMERIPEKDQPCGRHSIGNQHRCDPAAERLSTHPHGFPKISSLDEHRSADVPEHLLWIGGLASLFSIQEVEPQAGNSILRQSLRTPGEQRMIERRARPRAQNEDRTTGLLAGKQGRHGPPLGLNLQLFRHAGIIAWRGPEKPT